MTETEFVNSEIRGAENTLARDVPMLGIYNKLLKAAREQVTGPDSSKEF